MLWLLLILLLLLLIGGGFYHLLWIAFVLVLIFGIISYASGRRS